MFVKNTKIILGKRNVKKAKTFQKLFRSGMSKLTIKRVEWKMFHTNLLNSITTISSTFSNYYNFAYNHHYSLVNYTHKHGHKIRVKNLVIHNNNYKMSYNIWNCYYDMATGYFIVCLADAHKHTLFPILAVFCLIII